jgi:hypothetical protein
LVLQVARARAVEVVLVRCAYQVQAMVSLLPATVVLQGREREEQSWSSALSEPSGALHHKHDLDRLFHALMRKVGVDKTLTFD